MDAMKRRKSSVNSNPAEVSSRLGTCDMSPAISGAQFSPQENPLMIRPPIPEPRSRPQSLVSKKNNRLSISFPIQPSETIMSPGRQTPTQSYAFPSPIAANQSALPSPVDSAGFMVALAAQERKVFELREELNRAEVELKNLKSHWAMHEADKKRAEIKLQKLEPMQLSETNQTQPISFDDKDITRRSTELDRRKAILAANGPKTARRKIITGGHARALSLLSTERSLGQYPNFDSVERKRDSFDIGPGIHRKMTMPDSSQGLSRISSDRTRHSYQGSSTIGVKQIAEDLKAGLWTFMEDLRQATVGEEALQRSSIGSDTSRTTDSPVTAASSGGVKRTDQNKNRSPIRKKLVNIDRGTTETLKAGLMSKASNIGPQSLAQTAHPSTPTAKDAICTSTTTVDDDWSNWDSPSSKGASPRWSNSTMLSSDDASEAGKPCDVASELQNTMLIDTSPPEEDVSPWTALHNFTPVNLKRTASNFIKEFEKSLTPPPEPRSNRHNNSETPLFSKDKSISDNETRLLLNNLP